MSDSNKKHTPKNPLFAWQESKPGLAIIAILDLLIAYIFISLAIDTGSLLDYFISAVFFALGIGQGVKLVKNLRNKHGTKQ